MSKPETTFTAGVHKHLPAVRRQPYWMKNHNLYTSGIWDCWYSGAALDLWVEYKFEPLPARDSTVVPIDLSALQTEWGLHRHDEGRNLAVIVGCELGGVIFLHREWERQDVTRLEFTSRIITRKQIAEWIVDVTELG